MTSKLAFVLCIGLSVAAGAAEKPPRFQFRKTIELGQAPAEEIVAVPLDSDVYAATRDGYPDLRVRDDQGAFVPFVLEPIGKKQISNLREPCASKLQSLNVDEGKGLEIVVALDEKAPAAGGLTIHTPLANYEHRVRVFGSISGKDWAPLAADNVIFDYSRFMDIRNRDIALPANQFRQFKLVVEQELDDRESPLRELIRGQEDGKKTTRIEITKSLHTPFRIDRVELWRMVETEGRTENRTFAYHPPAFRVVDDASAKLSRVEVESRREPLTRLSIATASKNFSRKARVLVPVERGIQTDWAEIGQGTLVNIQFRTFHRAELHVEFPEQRQARYRLEIANADNHPLELTAVEALGTGYHVVFLKSEGRSYGLEYGSETAPEPSYDTRAVLASLERGYTPVIASLGPQVPNPASGSERDFLSVLNNPIFLIVVIIIMVAVLAWALFRAGTRLKNLPHEEV